MWSRISLHPSPACPPQQLFAYLHLQMFQIVLSRPRPLQFLFTLHHPFSFQTLILRTLRLLYSFCMKRMCCQSSKLIYGTKSSLHEPVFRIEVLPHTSLLHLLDARDSVMPGLEDWDALTATFFLLIEPSTVTDQNICSGMHGTEAPNTYTCVNMDRVHVSCIRKGVFFISMRKTYNSLQLQHGYLLPKAHWSKRRQTSILHWFKRFGVSPSQLSHSIGEFSVTACFLNVILYYKYCLNPSKRSPFYYHFISEWNWTGL